MLGVLLMAQMAIVAHAADSVSACEPLEVSVAVSAPGTALPHLVPPSFGPFQLLRSARTPHVERDSRAVPSAMIEYRYILVTDRTGEFVIPAFEARAGALTTRSAPLHVHVTPAREDATPAVLTRARIGTDDRADLRTAEPETVYVGQQADYTVTVFLNTAVQNRLRRNPTFYPPDMQSMLAYDVPGAGSAHGGEGIPSCFDALVYRRALFPLQPGRLVIPPAQLTYALPSGAGFFGREVTHELQTDSAVLVAVDPPDTGRPADFDGAVGRFRVTTRVGSSAGRVGDPLVLTIRVSGTGNVKLLPRPRLQVPWASAVPSDVRVSVDSARAHVGGSKEFDWILTPSIAGNVAIPAVRYAYFDPETRHYEVARADPAFIRVAPGALAAVDSEHQEPPLTVRPAYEGQTGTPWSSHPIFWLALALAPLPAASARWRQRRRAPGTRAPSALARMEAAAAATVPGGGRALRRAYAGALAERLAIDPETLTTVGALRRSLRRAGVSTETADEAEALLRELDAAAFSPGGRLGDDAGPNALSLIRRIDQEALPRRELPFRLLALGLLAALGAAGTVHALLAAAPADTFADGVVAYQEHNYSGARDAFRRVLVGAPRAADAWVNLGTSAWALHDTVDAVLGWRRGLGLQPLASDARDRLELVHGLRPTSPGFVPPVPLNGLLLLMAVCWVAACAAWHPSVARWRPGLARWPAPLVGCAALLALGAIALGGRFVPADVAIVRADATLRNDPAFGADQGPTVVTGEMVHVLNQHGAWNRVELDGGRQGWLPAQGLLPIDAPPSAGSD